MVGRCEDADDLMLKVRSYAPDVVVTDIRMPPTHTDEGLRAAIRIRETHPGVGVLVLSQYVEVGLAMKLLAESAEGVGYLLKDRVSDVGEFVGAVRRVGGGGSAIDPMIVSTLLGRRRDDDPIAELTPREREVLTLMAEGRSNQGIADRLVITLRAAEKYVSSIFTKLGLPSTGSDSRRVLAVLLYLRGLAPDETPENRPLGGRCAVCPAGPRPRQPRITTRHRSEEARHEDQSDPERPRRRRHRRGAAPGRRPPPAPAGAAGGRGRRAHGGGRRRRARRRRRAGRPSTRPSATATGFYAVRDARRSTTPTRALVSPDLDVGHAGPDWLLADGPARQRAGGRHRARDGPVFVGIARRGGRRRLPRRRVRTRSPTSTAAHAAATRRAGTGAPAPPASQGFWAKSAARRPGPRPSSGRSRRATGRPW